MALSSPSPAIEARKKIFNHTVIDFEQKHFIGIELVLLGVLVVNCKINSLFFVDDFVLLASSEQGVQHTLERFSAATKWE